MTESVNDGFGLAETRRTLPIALLRAREAVMERFRPVLNSHDITEQQWRVIRVLQEHGATDASKLAELACILPPSLTRMLKSLEARGFIESRRDTADGRRSIVTLTETGQRFMAEVSPTSAAVYADIEARIGPERIKHLLDELEFLLTSLGQKG